MTGSVTPQRLGARTTGSFIVTREDLNEALLRLYNPAELAKTRLAALFVEKCGVKGSGEALRRLLLDTIESLRPSSKAAPRASEYRAYQCITMRYISAMTIGDIAAELCLSRRQVFRDLRFGLSRLAQLLSEALCQPQEVAPADPLGAEMGSLQARAELVDVARVFPDAVATVSPLAKAKGVLLSWECPAGQLLVSASPALLREALVQLLSALVQSLPAVHVSVAASVQDIVVAVDLPGTQALSRQDLLSTALRVATSQGFDIREQRTEERVRLLLSAPRAGTQPVLVVEDNPAAFALYERYLAKSGWEPILAPHPRAAVAMAVANRAVAIILDIMMPDQDGWRVLQALKVDPQAQGIPVIVCSVVNDPELGFALGASAYLTKPLSRLALIAALEEVVRGRKAT